MERLACITVIGVLACWSVCPAEQVALAGIVVGPDAAAISGATVGTRYLVDEETREHAWGEAMTNDQGKFTLRFDSAEPRAHCAVIATKEGFALGCAYLTPGEESRIELGAAPASFSGTVLDAQGNPLPGAQVWVSHVSLPDDGGRLFFWLGHAESPLQTRSDQEGGFQFGGLPPDATLDIGASFEGCAPHSSGDSDEWPLVGETLVITMQPGAALSGGVFRDGEPVAGVMVYAHRRGAVSRRETDEDGAYCFENLPADSYTVRLVPPDGYTAVPRANVKLEPAQSLANVDLELIEGAVIEGAITVAGTGEPAAGAHVGAAYQAVPGLPYWADTDDQGHYRLRVPPGTAKLWVYYGSATGRCEPPEVWLELENGDHETGVDFAVKLPARFAGVVLNLDGQPAPGVSVWVQGQLYGPEPPEPIQTDERGCFELVPEGHLARGPWMVFAQDAERGLCGLVFLQEARDSIEAQLRPGAYATAEVVDLDGNPVADVRVRVWVTYDGTSGHNLPLRMVSDENGHLAVGPLPARQRLEVLPGAEADRMAVNSAWWDLGQYELQPGETRQLPPLILNPGGRALRGTVVDQDEQPLANATVITDASLTDRRVKVVTDEAGRFELTGLKARGDVNVIVIAHDGRSAFGMPCDPDLPFEPVFALEPPGVVQGVVYDAGGEPKIAAEVSVYASGFRTLTNLPSGLRVHGRMNADERGRWRLEGLVPGLEYRVWARDAVAGAAGASERFIAGSGNEPTVLDIHMQ